MRHRRPWLACAIVPLLVLLFLGLLPEGAYAAGSGYQQNQILGNISALMQAMMQLAYQIGSLLRQNSVAIAQGVMPTVLFSAAIFAGWRIIFGRPILDELLDYTLIAFLAWLLIYAQAPQLLIDQYRQAMISGGQQIGRQIAQMGQGDGSPTTQDPVDWWFSWMGMPTTTGQPSPQTFKFGPYYIGTVMFRNVLGPFGGDSLAGPFGDQKLYKQLTDALTAVMNALVPTVGQPRQPEPSQLNTILLIGIPLITSLGMVIGLIVTAAILAITAVFTLLFTQILILAGSELAYQALLAFGLAMLPFIFFTSFRGIWRPMLQALAATALVPTLYFVFAGAGFALSKTIFHYMFGQSENSVFGQAIPSVLQAMVGWPFPGTSTGTSSPPSSPSILSAIINVIGNALKGLNLGDGGGMVQNLPLALYGLVEVAAAWAFYSLGVNIVAAFIHAGSMFPFVAARIAFGWSSAFADMGGALLEGFTQSYSRIHGAVTEGMRSAGQDAIGRVTSWVQGVASRK